MIFIEKTLCEKIFENSEQPFKQCALYLYRELLRITPNKQVASGIGFDRTLGG